MCGQVACQKCRWALRIASSRATRFVACQGRSDLRDLIRWGHLRSADNAQEGSDQRRAFRSSAEYGFHRRHGATTTAAGVGPARVQYLYRAWCPSVATSAASYISPGASAASGICPDASASARVWGGVLQRSRMRGVLPLVPRVGLQLPALLRAAAALHDPVRRKQRVLSAGGGSSAPGGTGVANKAARASPRRRRTCRRSDGPP